MDQTYSHGIANSVCIASTHDSELSILESQLILRDFVLEPSAIPIVDKFISESNQTKVAYECLFEGYECEPFAIFVLQDILEALGTSAEDINKINSNHFSEFVLRHFDPKKADDIFSAQEIPNWLESMIHCKYWREMIYKLLDTYPECLMLKLTQDLIANSAYHTELMNARTASTHFSYFQTIFIQSLSKLLGNLAEAQDKNSKYSSFLKEFIQLALNSQHAYLFSQTALHYLTYFSNIQLLTSNENKTEPADNEQTDSVSTIATNQYHLQNRFLLQYLSNLLTSAAREKSLDPTRNDMLVRRIYCETQIFSAVQSILTKKALHLSDVNYLYNYFSQETPLSSSVQLLRVPILLDLLVETIFSFGSSTISDYVEKCIFLLAFIVTIQPSDLSPDATPPDNQTELQETIDVLKETRSICTHLKQNYSDIQLHFNNLHIFIAYPVVSKGILCWLSQFFSQNEFFQMHSISGYIYFALLDEIAERHTLLHQDVFTVLTNLFDLSLSHHEVEIHQELELQQNILDHVIHLFVCGHSLEVLQYIINCIDKGIYDYSLIRHFVSEVLEVITPPFSPDLTQLLTVILNNEEISGPLQNQDRTDPVSLFLAQTAGKYKKKKK